uniref:NF2 n=1 Tax=synthetic construct TaxID=32630 RepID=UPI001AA00D4F|nr:Chain A, NF2 [synthetic construct]
GTEIELESKNGQREHYTATSEDEARKIIEKAVRRGIKRIELRGASEQLIRDMQEIAKQIGLQYRTDGSLEHHHHHH